MIFLARLVLNVIAVARALLRIFLLIHALRAGVAE